MKRGSLWSVLMVAWLSAAGAPHPQDGPALTNMAVSGPEEEIDSAALADIETSSAVLPPGAGEAADKTAPPAPASS